MKRGAQFGPLLFAAIAAPLVAQQGAPPTWPEFHAATLGITFRHPPTKGLRFEARAATCAASDRTWQGGVPDSMVVVTRSVARLEQVAAFVGMVRAGSGWIAQGYEGRTAPVASVRVEGWEALVTDQAVTVVYDMEVRSPVTARQWRLVAMGPAKDGCRPLLVAVATGMSIVWDSSAVAKVLESARLRH